jgi:MarR family transcriptional regulator, organic hydroperoxide resistance regulator
MASNRPPLRAVRTAAASNPLALDRQLCFALYSSSLAMTRHYRPLLEALGLTYPQYLVMLALWESDGQVVSQLGTRLFLDSGTLTPLLKRLESLGLIERRRDLADERRVVVSLTQAGQAMRREALGIPVALAAGSGCTLDEIDDLTAMLGQLRAALLAGPGAPIPTAA